MRYPSLNLIVFLAVLPLAACAPPEEPVDVEAEARAVMELEREWGRRFQAGDIGWIANRHASDGRIMPQGSEAVVGRAAVREVWEGFHETEGLSLDFWPNEAHVAESGDMAYVLGAYDLTLPDGNEDRGKVLVVWVKEDDEWRVAVDMFNSNLAPEPAEAEAPADETDEADEAGEAEGAEEPREEENADEGE